MKGIHIILTSTINITKKQVKDNFISVKIKQTDPEERKACYLKAIKYWLDHTDFNITLVENSGYDYSELDEYKEKYADKFECISFDIHNEPDAVFIFNDFKYLSKGLLELYSIHYAYNHSRLIKEISLSLINGLALAIILIIFGQIVNQDLLMSLTIAGSMMGVIVIAALVGTFVPIILEKQGIDPAIATGPFITTANDIFGIFLFFYIAKVALGF